MGISCFIAPIADTDALTNAIRSCVAHNLAPMTPLGGVYTDEEFAALDPRRTAFLRSMKDLMPGVPMEAGCREKWTRGEDLQPGGSFVEFRDTLWLEVANGGGGACTTRWLKEHAPDVGWIGTEGKPDGFKEAPSVGQAHSLRELASLGAALLGRR